MARKKVFGPIQGQYQQGDVVLERVSGVPADAEPVKGATLAEGEGHHLHRFVIASNVELFTKDGVRFARVKQDTEIEHVTHGGDQGEHNPITIPAGDYKFGQVQEWDYLAEMAREVLD